MKKITTNLFAIALICFGVKVSAGHLSPSLLFSAKLDGSQEVPAVTTNATGVASFTLNPTRDTMCVNISVQGLSGSITGIHVHEGAAGSNGGVVTDLSPFVVDNRIAATLTGADLTPAILANYFKGLYYLNVHTAANPNGEIRGQIMLEADHGFTADMNGAQEVPSVTTNAYGLGVFTLSHDQTKLKFQVIMQDLSGAATGAHLHMGASGSSGGVVEDLGPFLSGNVINGEVDPTSYLSDLLAGNIYINIHTAANPNGEIRGQLLMSKHLMFDSWLNGAQEVPSVTTTAEGVSRIKLNSTLDTLWYDVVVNDLSGLITGAHFHNAAVGSNGGVELDLTSDINGNRINGMTSGAILTNTLVNKFLTGDIYLNLHTTANSNGEIRGQVYRLAREGYTFSLDGSQEVPAVSTSAMGSGLVSIDRDQTNAHFMIVYSDLTAANTGAHFHQGTAGQNGGVIFDLSPFFSQSSASDDAFGYWKSTDATPFTTASSVLFRNNEVYVNVHSAVNPNGEIRGDVIRGTTCFQITVGIEEEFLAKEFLTEIYPNPANERVTLKFNSSSTDKITVVIFDITGNKILETTTTPAIGMNDYLMNIDNLPQGLYLLQLRNSEGLTTKRFVKK